MEGFDNERLHIPEVLKTDLTLEALQDVKANKPKTSVFDLMATIYNYMSECYTHSDIYNRTKAIKVLTEEIAAELLAEIEGLEP